MGSPGKGSELSAKYIAKASILLLILVAGVLLAKELAWTDIYWLWSSRSSFVEYRIPLKATQLIMDVGVVDVNNDDVLDIFTTNHNYRQDLLIADAKGGYRDMVSAWRLDQSPEFPGLEIALGEPKVDDAGVYIYWKGRKTLTIRTYKIKEVGLLQGKLRTYTTVNSFEGQGFKVEGPVVLPAVDKKMQQSVLAIASASDGELNLEIETPGLPVNIQLTGSVPLKSVHIGNQRVSPRTTNFDLTFQDRHGMAWSDYNDDGRMDVFITRGALGGTLRDVPDDVAGAIRDELLVSQSGEQYLDIGTKVGIEKRGCSGRKVTWVDIDNDGLLDLFVNCQDRGSVKGEYPKQLYRQKPDKQFVEVAAEVGLDLPERELIDFVWFDADNDGYIDLVTSEATGFYLYRNLRGKSFTRESIGRGKFARADNPQLKGTVDEYWFVDGKLVVADFKGDGKLHVFSASKTGNALLLNDGSGRFSIVDPATVGLPSASVTASWVDFDNDGLPDLFSVPQGLLRQRGDHTFAATGLLALPARKYMAAIVNWADFDNDGRRDILLALNENFSLWRWWEKATRDSEDRFAWSMVSYRNVVPSGHWLQMRLVGRTGNPPAIGARVTVDTPDGKQTQQVGLNDGAFFSQGHYRLYFGLGTRTQTDVVSIRWPDGQIQELKALQSDKLHVVRQDTVSRP